MEEVGASNPTPFDQQIRPGRPYGPNNQPFGPKDQRWHADPAHYDQCCDQELHVAYSLYQLCQTFLLILPPFRSTGLFAGAGTRSSC